MKRAFSVIVLALLIGFTDGCATKTPRKIAADTMFSIHETTDAAVKAYLDGVIAGKIPTNGVPKVAQEYQIFQANFAIATGVLALSTNAIAPSSLVLHSTVVLQEIAKAKKGCK